jgi:hypothetical protein
MPREGMGGNGSGLRGRRQSRWLRTADGFAVCSSTNFAALVGLCILTWIKEADCDPVVEIMSRVPNEGAVFRAD